MQPETIAYAPTCAFTEDSIASRIAATVGRRAYEHWFLEKTSLTVQDDELTVGVASPFLVDWFQKQFRVPVNQAAREELGASARVRFAVDPEISTAVQSDDREKAAVTKRSQSAEPRQTTAKPQRKRGRRFADLGDFVQGRCNELALSAANQVCDSPGANFNPLFIHGPVGTGKTHLLEGIYREIRRGDSQLQVVFLTSEAFANYFTEALRNHTLPSFRQRFRSVDVLLIDDVEFLEGKRVIQEEFLHTFKQLISHGRQVVLTGGRHPRLCTKMSDELRTRLLSGMVCRLESPDAGTRLEILRHKAERNSGRFADEALEFIADRFSNNVRELEGALNCLQAYHRMTNKRVTVSAAKRVLADLQRDCLRVVRIADVEKVVCDLFGVDSQKIQSAERSRSLSQPRMLAMYLARKHTQAAYSEIGGYFGGRNHSTVISAEKKINKLVKTSATLKVASQDWAVEDLLSTLEQQLQVG